MSLSHSPPKLFQSSDRVEARRDLGAFLTDQAALHERLASGAVLGILHARALEDVAPCATGVRRDEGEHLAGRTIEIARSDGGGCRHRGGSLGLGRLFEPPCDGVDLGGREVLEMGEDRALEQSADLFLGRLVQRLHVVFSFLFNADTKCIGKSFSAERQR